jgi:mono/diheme cytochrome c family protein
MALRRGKVLLWVIFVVVFSAAAWAYWFVRIHGFSARERPTKFEAVLARHARRIATPQSARDLCVPLDPTPLNIAEARDHFADHCAICHANNGSGKTQINAGLFPPAPDMRQKQTQDLTDGEIFYIIKNGIRFTGMPGWSGEDEENWKLVLFIRHLPNLTPKELQLMYEVNSLEKEHEDEQTSEPAQKVSKPHGH